MRYLATVLLIVLPALGQTEAQTGTKSDNSMKAPKGVFRVPSGSFSNRQEFKTPNGTFAATGGEFKPSGELHPDADFKRPQGEFSPQKGEFSSRGDFRAQPGVFNIGHGFLKEDPPKTKPEDPSSEKKQIRIVQ